MKIWKREERYGIKWLCAVIKLASRGKAQFNVEVLAVTLRIRVVEERTVSMNKDGSCTPPKDEYYKC
jgi:hypothetical protein